MLHLGVRHRERPYHGCQWGKKYFQKSNLTRHLKVHNGQKSCDCKECGRTSGSSDSHNRINEIFQEEFARNCMPSEGVSPEAITDQSPVTGSNEILTDLHEDQGNINIPQNNDLIDDHSPVNDFLDNLQLPSPQGSEISYGNIMSVNTLVGFLDESIEALQTTKEITHTSPNDQRYRATEVAQSDLFTEHCESGISKYTRVSHENDKSYQYDQCEKSFRLKVTLNEHLKTHYKKHLYKCHQCGKTYKLKIYLMRHMALHCTHLKVHHEEISFDCNLCGKTFRKYHQYRWHVKYHNRGQYRCNVCGVMFTSEHHLGRHLKTEKHRKMEKVQKSSTKGVISFQ